MNHQSFGRLILKRVKHVLWGSSFLLTSLATGVASLGFVSSAHAVGTNVGPHICVPINPSHVSRLRYRQGFLQNIDRNKNVTVVCTIPVNRENNTNHYMQVVFEHDATNQGRNKPFRIVFGIIDNLGKMSQSRTAIVNKPGEVYALDTTDSEFGTTNFTTEADQPNWIATVKLRIPPRSKVFSLFYVNQ